MKNIITVAVLLISSIFYAQNTGVTGKWKTIDDETGQAKSIVEIYEKSGKIYGRVMEIFDVNHKKDLCNDCSGEDANKPILGLTIIKGLSKDGNEYNSGEIMDPKNGRHYRCTIVLQSKDKLKVRGYIGFAILGRTQYWYRVK
ncbi:DUF2147 domain-containing protein [Flavobacterium degerlachei]|jgi:uncharacterized protein (DUF2147 family)|uniref:Uncharacterized conserved protein, DUF2147 family n=1 Tax=Flavobacterium degerlachei TaxID=229203 RepID=A0A1H2ZUH7_9FLAO|nr:DUF2147 domain-containing protein [Flavobacterium degerlachei]SDX21242.1 Uncharacterized conserved protein, DUF2147 family [Flavobacterium degerlachei]